MNEAMLARPLSASEDPESHVLLGRHYARVATRTDRLFAWLLAAEFIAVNVLAYVLSPQDWAGGVSSVHLHVWASLLLGGVLALGPITISFLLPGRALTRHTIAIAQMLMTGLIIHVSGGRLETHFLVFGSLAFLAFYRDWRVIVTASLITSADHFLRGTFLPQSVYGSSVASIWRTAEHIGWVVFADIFLITSCLQSSREMLKVALKRSQLERTTASVEAMVIARTRELEASQALFDSFMQHTPNIGFIVDREGKGVWLNRSGEELFGIPQGSWKGKPVIDSFGEEIGQAILDVDRKVLHTGKPVVTERAFHTTLGIRTFSTTRFPIVDSTGTLFVGGTSIDVTERLEHSTEMAKARDAALEATRLKSEFLANMSHEIRTPMNGILGLSNLLLEQPLEEEQRDYAETIVSSANALLTIINDILDFSKIEAGKLSFDHVVFDVKEAVEETIELLAPSARKKEIELVIDICDSCPEGVRGDPGRLRQVLTNLLSNAIKFTEAGEVRVTLTGHAEGEMAALRFDVWDTGIGISQEAIGRLFNTFTQADGSTTRKYGGSGLGLAIAKQLVQQMEGEIGVTSEPNVGSHFWFTVRLPQEQLEPSQPEADLTGRRVLIVDDHPTNRLVLERQLSDYGVIHHSAADGRSALAYLSAAVEVPDVVILDVQMPDIDGLEVARQIRTQEALDRCRIVLLSSSATALTTEEMRQDGIDLALLKPVRKAKLRESLARILGERRKLAASLAALPIAQEAGEGRGLRILVAEDNVVNQKVVRAQLKKLGYTADLVANGREAVEAFERVPYDIILMDCQMPEMDGFDASRTIRATESATGANPIRIIALTANAMESDRERCLAAGMNDYLSKPVRVEDLDAVLLACAKERTRWSA